MVLRPRPLAVTVEDANGNAVAGATVTLSATGLGDTFGTDHGYDQCVRRVHRHTGVHRGADRDHHGNRRQRSGSHIRVVRGWRSPTLSVSSDPTATRGQSLALSDFVTISDLDFVGYTQLELLILKARRRAASLWSTGGGQIIDITPANFANTVYDVGTAGGTDAVYARLDVMARSAAGSSSP